MKNLKIALVKQDVYQDLYVCPSSECLEKAIRNHGIERSLKTVVPQEVYEDLKKELSKIEKQQ